MGEIGRCSMDTKVKGSAVGRAKVLASRREDRVER